MSPEIKNILNSLRCPLCNGQVDGLYGNFKSRIQSFWCVYSKDHYEIVFVNDIIDHEIINLYDFDKRINYSIYKRSYSLYKFDIHMRKIDGEGRPIFDFTDEVYFTDLNIFDFRNFNKEKALERIKTVILFE